MRVYSPAKTVAVCFKYRHKYGLDVAIEALRDGWPEKKFTMNELSKAAAVCRVSQHVAYYWLERGVVTGRRRRPGGIIWIVLSAEKEQELAA